MKYYKMLGPLILFICTAANGQAIIADTYFINCHLPLHRLQVTSAYGWRIHPITGKYQFHQGVDLAAYSDTVYCVLDGVVAKIANDPLTGNYIVIDHQNNIQSIYGHLSAIGVLPGDTVLYGQAIAITGASGLVTGEHLHFALKSQGHFIPPLEFLYHLQFQ